MPKPYIPNDKWSQRAAKEGYRARSVYKLIELDERFGLIKPGMTVVDLGAAPGSWLQYASKMVGPEGEVIGIDLQEIKPVADNVFTERADFTDEQELRRILAKYDIDHVDLVLCDAAPNTSGIKDVDQWKSVELAQAAAAIAKNILKPAGKCVVKVLRGSDFDPFLKDIRYAWYDVECRTVQASRDRSTEAYVVFRKSEVAS